MAKVRRGPPRKPDPRCERIQLCVTEAELEAIRRLAGDTPLSQWVRARARVAELMRAPRGRGRPRVAERRIERVVVPLSEAEAQAIDRAAEGTPRAAWIRRMALAAIGSEARSPTRPPALRRKRIVVMLRMSELQALQLAADGEALPDWLRDVALAATSPARCCEGIRSVPRPPLHVPRARAVAAKLGEGNVS